MAHPSLAEAHAEVLGGDLLEMVGLVEDHVLVGREKADAARAQREIGEEERMVADEDVGVLHASPRGLVEAAVEGRAATAHAVVGVRLDLVPHARGRHLRQRRERSVPGLVGPVLDPVQGVAFRLVGKESILAFRGQRKATKAGIVAAALHEHCGELVGHHRVQQRQVLLDELLLQADGVCADDHPLALLDHAADRRKQVGEALADTGPGLDEQMLLPFHRRLDRARHLHLLGTNLEAGETSGDRPDLGEKGGAIQRHGGSVAGATPRRSSGFRHPIGLHAARRIMRGQDGEFAGSIPSHVRNAP